MTKPEKIIDKSGNNIGKSRQKNSDIMNRSFNLIAILLMVFLIGFFLEETIGSSNLGNYDSLEETFEIISELFSVFVALSIFSITWHAYNNSKDNHSLFLGTTFLITGFLILCHLLSYPFMPDFITPNSPHKAAIFFLESRFILAFLLFASVYVHKDSFPKLINKSFMVLFTTAILSVFLASTLFYHDFIFMGFKLDSYSTVTVFLLSLITIIILVTGYLYNRRAKETVKINLNYLATGSIIVLVSNLVYFPYEFSGHFLIITGFLCFYLGLYKSSVELPYERLSISEEKLRHAAEEKYRRLFDKANDAIVTIDMGGRVISWNKSAEKLFGFTLEEITGKSFVEAVALPETVVQKEKMMIFELLSDTFTGRETVCIRKDRTRINVSFTVSPLLDANYNVAERSLIIRDITDHKQMENALHASEEKFEKAFRSSPQALTITGLNDGRFIEVNNSFTSNLGYSHKEAIGHTTLELGLWLTPEDRIRFISALKENGSIHNAEVDLRTKKGDIASILISAEFIDVAGKACMLSTFYDITGRKKAEEKIKKSLEEKEVLLREIHHRVKNNMQIVSSLLMLQSQYIEDKKYKDVFIESQTRIHSMALIHEKLYQSENLAQINFKEYIEGIVSNIFESYCIKSNIKIDINIENIPIIIDYAVPCGLIINELVTNSLKYAFPDGREGKIQISLKSNDNNTIQLSIRDDGIGIAKDMDIRNKKSLGLHLITALAEGQLHGEIILNRERGTEFQISFGAK